MKLFTSRPTSSLTATLLAALIAAAVLLAFAADAAAEESALEQGLEASFQVGYHSGRDGDEVDLKSWGLRYQYGFTERWGIEGLYTSKDQRSIDSEIFEISARFAFFRNERVRVIALAGAGSSKYDYTYFTVAGEVRSEDDDSLVYHLGIAAEIALGDRLYLRPETRQRWAVDLLTPHDDESFESTLGVGFRF